MLIELNLEERQEFEGTDSNPGIREDTLMLLKMSHIKAEITLREALEMEVPESLKMLNAMASVLETLGDSKDRINIFFEKISEKYSVDLTKTFTYNKGTLDVKDC